MKKGDEIVNFFNNSFNLIYYKNILNEFYAMVHSDKNNKRTKRFICKFLVFLHF